MAEETPMSPISEAVPPKANPLATPASAHAATLKLKPVIRRPVTGAAGATQTALKPGLKLPPKPGLATAGLKLPPKPGATVSGLKPGIKLPTQSGLKPGIKLPARPVIHAPDAAITTPSPLAPKAETPAASTVSAVAPVAEMTPVADLAPVDEAPKAVAPAVTELDVPKPEQPKPLDALKAVTQNLKSITSPIPQQAILRKTGIIADAEMTAAQKQAAKSKTARISLSDAMGVAPVKNEALPMKTIRIKRPTDIPGATNPTATAKPLAPSSAEPAQTVDTQAETKVAAEAQSTSFTQRKTLKISRPGGGAVRPSGKFGVKKPTTVAAPAGEPAAAAGDEVADIPEMPVAVSAPAPVAVKDRVPDVPKGVATMGLVVQIAACLAIGFLGWLLYENWMLPFYCGGCQSM